MNKPNLPKAMMRAFLFLLAVALLQSGRLSAADQISQPAPPESAPEAAPEAPAAAPAEKAPPAARPTAQPQFTLPEVVITGDNQLTIGAQRLDRREDDVTLGSKDLRGLNRASDDLPGLDQSRTGVSALSPEPPRDTVGILHLGAGLKKSLEGWGLFGHQDKAFQILLKGFGDRYGGEVAGPGRTASDSLGWGAVLQAQPTDRLKFHFSRQFEQTHHDLPWQSGRENRKPVDLDGSAAWSFASDWTLSLKGAASDTRVDAADPLIPPVTARERRGSARVEYEGPSWAESLWAEGGVKTSRIDLAPPVLSAYDDSWAKIGTRLRPSNKLGLTASWGFTRFAKLDLPDRGEPSVELEFLPLEATRVRIHWKSARSLPSFRDLEGEAFTTLPVNGLPVPGWIRDEIGGDLTHRWGDRLTATLGGRAWWEENRSQWEESSLLENRQVLESLGLVRLWEGTAGLEWTPLPSLVARADLRYGEAQDRSGTDLRVTGWARQQAQFSVGHSRPGASTRLFVMASGRREGDSSNPVPLSPYWTLGLETRRDLGGHVTLWGRADNLTGQRYEIRPGYPEPRFLARVGLEVVF